MFSWEGEGKLLRRHKMADLTLTVLSHKHMLHTSNLWYGGLAIEIAQHYNSLLHGDSSLVPVVQSGIAEIPTSFSIPIP